MHQVRTPAPRDARLCCFVPAKELDMLIRLSRLTLHLLIFTGIATASALVTQPAQAGQPMQGPAALGSLVAYISDGMPKTKRPS